MNPFEFANPVGWWWAALAVPIIAFYILKVRLRRQPVSTMLFWDKVFDEKKPRAWWQQLRHWLSLLLQLAMLMLLVGALVDPLWSWQKNQRRKIVLVVDNSASMAVTEDGQSRFDQAKLTASALARSLRVGDEMAVLTAGGNTKVAIGLTGHVGSLLEAISRIALTDSPNSLTAAVQMAKRLVPESPQSKVMILTDGCDSAIEALQQDATVTVYGFGSPKENLAITQFQVRRSLLDAIGYQVLVEVSNLGTEAKKCRLELNLESDLVDVVPIELAAGASKTLHLDHASAKGGRLIAQLDSADGLEVDNRALAVLPTRRKMPITLATSGSVFLKSVLESIPLVDLSVVEALPESWKGHRDSILVLHQDVPEKLPPGKLLVINPRKSCDLWTVGDAIETPLVSTVVDTSPITQHVRLTNVLFPEARAMTFTSASDVLIKTPLDEPLLVHLRRAGGDVLVLNVNLDLGDLPLRIAFPVLMKNAVEWFQGSQGELQPALATGQSTTVRLPQASSVPGNASTTSTAKDDSPTDSNENEKEGIEVVKADEASGLTSEFMLRSPAAELTPLARDELQAVLSTLNYCGLWTIGTRDALKSDPWATLDAESGQAKSEAVTLLAPDDPQLVRLAVNLCNREESDLKPRIELESPNDFAMLSLGGRSIWFYLVIAGLILAAIEWWLYQRRVVG